MSSYAKTMRKVYPNVNTIPFNSLDFNRKLVLLNLRRYNIRITFHTTSRLLF